MKLEVLLDREEAAELLERLADAVEQGSLAFGEGGSDQSLVVGDELVLTLKAQRARAQNEVVLTLQWQPSVDEQLDLIITG